MIPGVFWGKSYGILSMSAIRFTVAPRFMELPLLAYSIKAKCLTNCALPGIKHKGFTPSFISLNESQPKYNNSLPAFALHRNDAIDLAALLFPSGINQHLELFVNMEDVL